MRKLLLILLISLEFVSSYGSNKNLWNRGREITHMFFIHDKELMCEEGMLSEISELGIDSVKNTISTEVDHLNIKFNEKNPVSTKSSDVTQLSSSGIAFVGSIPSAVGAISGPPSVCKGSTGIQYTVTGSSATSGYSWTVPSGATITAGAGTNIITVSFVNANAGTGQFIYVTGNSLTANLSISVYAPPTSIGIITGSASVCPGQAGVIYTLTGVSDAATTFAWTPPSNATMSANGLSATIGFLSSFTSGTISVRLINGPCPAGPLTVKAITATTLPATPGTITGPSAVTPGFVGIAYSVPAVANATSYQWNLPAGASVASGSGTNNITINFATSFTGGNITVQGLNGTCSSPASLPLAITLLGYPGMPGTISGNNSPCTGASGTAVTYSVPAIANTTSYNWIITGGATPVGNTTSNTISINFPPDIPGTSVTISVNGVNAQGSGPSSTLLVTVYKPAVSAGIISGPLAVCQSQAGVVFSVAPIQNATAYGWTPPSGATITSGAGTNSVTMNFSSTYVTGNLVAFGVAGPCGTGTSSLLSVSTPPALPSATGVITGSAVVCQGNTGIIYSVANTPSATSYVWTLPSGGTIISGQNTNSITVNYSASAANGNISVYGTNCVGNGPPSSMPIIVSTLPVAAGVISGNTTPCLGDGVVNYSVPAITNATGYTWSVPSGATIVTGQNTNSITVNYSLSAVAGNITVMGTNCKGNSTASSLAITYATSGLGNIGAKRIEPSVDLATGIMSTSVPLFSVQDGDIQVPGILNYTATGVRVTDDDGWVGHNWNLSAQSYMITRELRGLPDDYTATSPDNRKGWLNSVMAMTVKNFSPTTDNNTTTCTDEVANYNTLNTINYDQDTEPDVFYLSAPGLSFKFYFDENKVPRAMPYQDIIITPNTLTGPISSFAVKDSRGVTYSFAEAESITESVQTPNANFLIRQSNLFKNPITYNTAWHLTSITSPIYGTVSFTYRTVNVSDDALYPDWYKKTNQYKYRFQIDFDPKPFKGGTNHYTSVKYSRVMTIKILQKISTPNMEAIFTSTPRYVGSSLERLNSISIYDKREGTSKLINTISLLYTLSGAAQQRAFLTTIRQSSACLALDYTMEYYSLTLPSHESAAVDKWGFFLVSAPDPYVTPLPYAESSIAGSLKKITYPYKGYDAFIYEPHDYWDGNTNVQGGGIRLHKMISYDGVSSNSDKLMEYEYKAISGQTKSSGKLQYQAMHDFEVACYFNNGSFGNSGTYIRNRDFIGNPDFFTIHTNEELSHYNMLHGSIVAYERVVVKEKDAGQSIYEFDLPASFGDASANANEWKASEINIARPSAPTGYCFDLGTFQPGINKYPFPPNPEYEFAKALLKKVTNLREDGTIVRDVVYTYQRVYGSGSTIRIITGLALEELLTYYYNGSAYVNGKMFAYSQYKIFTDVKTEINSEVETIYNSNDLSKKTVTTSNYFFDSPYHKELTRVETLNSDGSLSKNKIKYSKDYVISTPSGIPSTALKNLNTANQMVVVETLSTKVIGGTEKYMGSSLNLFQTISGKIYPDKQYSFVSTDGSTTFTPSSISGGTTFLYDQGNYVLDKTYSSFDSYGNSTCVIGRSKNIGSVAYGYSGTLPVIDVSNASISEIGYSDFETSALSNFFISGFSPTYTVGRTSSTSKGLNLPAGSATTSNLVISPIGNNKSKNYIFSCWVKSTTAGNFQIRINNTTTLSVIFPYAASTAYKYYSFIVPVAPTIGTNPTFYIYLWSNSAIQIDDIAFYPEQADFVTTTYSIPNGKTSETDSHGISHFYDYDPWGRLKVVYDKDRNVVKKYDYQVRP